MKGQPKARPEIEAMLEELFARNGALETMQAQLVLVLAGLTDDPAASIRMTMADVQANLRGWMESAIEAKDPAEIRISRRALEFAGELTARLVATRRHPGPKSTQ